MPTTLIRREHFATGVHVRETADGTPSRTIEGYAIVFDVPSVPLYDFSDESMREIIAREAVTRELLDGSDIKLTMFHNRELILARSNRGKGSLSYEIDDKGVRFRCDLPETADGDKALRAIERGDISGCSFAFSCPYSDPQCVEVQRTKGDSGKTEVTCTVRSISHIHDFTLAIDPAYEQTGVSLREIVAAAAPQSTEPEPEPEPEQREDPEQPEQTEQPAETQTQPEPETQPTNTPDMPTETTNAQSVVETPQERHIPTIYDHVRENYGRGLSRIEVRVLTREEATGSENTVTSTAVADGGLMPIRFQGILDPLMQATVYDKIGIPLSYSNSGQFLWNLWKGGAATFIGESETAVAQKLELSKLTAEPKRIAVRYDLTRESLYQSGNAVEDIVRKAIAMNLAALINLVICSPTHPAGVPADIKSPFESAKVVKLSKAPTFKEINSMKAQLLAKGIDLSGVVFVVSAATYTALEATPKDAGSGIMVLADGRMCGIPVFISEDITDGYIGLGDFSMQPSGFFGDITLIVDPYTRAAENEVRFILNTGFATKTLRSEAFVLGEIATA